MGKNFANTVDLNRCSDVNKWSTSENKKAAESYK